MERVILLNSDYSFLNYIAFKDAMRLVTKRKVEVIKEASRIIWRRKEEIMYMPMVLRLVKLVRSVYKNKVPFSKRNVLIRDEYTCQYCGVKSTSKMTWDHVTPKGQGGYNSWENCVTACKPCNNKKGNRTPRQAKMFLKRTPYAPTIMEFLRIRMKNLGIVDLLIEMGVY